MLPTSVHAKQEKMRRWISYLREPGRRKHKDALQSVSDPEARCCLGHLCHTLNIPFKEYRSGGRTYIEYLSHASMLPGLAAEQIGITPSGEFKNLVRIGSERRTYDASDRRYVGNEDLMAENLMQVNDLTDLSPREIGDLIDEQWRNDNFHRTVPPYVPDPG